MNEVDKNKVEIQQISTMQKPKESSKIIIGREIIAGIIWIFLIIKIFIYDIDVYMLSLINPKFVSILNYKFFILITIFAIIWAILGNKKFLTLISVIIFYPFIFLFWRIPSLFWKSKSWIGVFTTIGVLLTFFNSFKFNFFVFIFIAFSILFISSSTNIYFLIPSMIVLIVFLLYHYFKRFKYAFQPSHLFTIQTQAINKYWEKVKNGLKIAEEIKETEFDSMSDEQKTKWSQNLQLSIILNKVFYFLTSKLRKFQKSRLNIIYYFINILNTVFLTTIIFTFQNFALYKIDPNSFNTVPKGNIIFFFYYSFNTLFTNSINDFYPISDMARLLNSFETFFAFVLLAILFFLLTTIVRDKHNEEINSTITTFKDKGKDLEVFINQEFNIDIDKALVILETFKSNMLSIIYYFIKNIDEENV